MTRQLALETPRGSWTILSIALGSMERAVLSRTFSELRKVADAFFAFGFSVVSVLVFELGWRVFPGLQDCLHLSDKADLTGVLDCLRLERASSADRLNQAMIGSSRALPFFIQNIQVARLNRLFQNVYLKPVDETPVFAEANYFF